MLPLESVHLAGLEKPGEKQFQRMFVNQVEKAKNSVFDEITKEICGSSNHIYLANRYFGNRKSVTKEKLGMWLETVCHILNEYCIPWLQRADDDIQKLNNEKLVDQTKIIDLQNQLIEKQEEQLSAVKTTVATEMKSYSSAVMKSCNTALAPKKIQAAVMKVADTNERSKNVIVYGLEENDGEQLEKKVEEVLIEIDEKPLIEQCVRVGTKKDGSKRPVKCSLKSTLHVQRILNNARKLRTKDGFSSIYISPDRTLDERRAYKKLVEEMNLRRSKEPDKVHVIKNNKIVSFSRQSEPGETGMT